MSRDVLERFQVASVLSPLLLVLLTFAVRVPFFDEPPGRDQGLFMAQAWQWLAGAGLYDEIWEHKPGGIVALYGLAVGLGGLKPTSVQILHGLAGALTAVALLGLARRAGLHVVTATLGGIFYLFFFGGPLFGGFWATAQVEIFVDPLVALVLLLLVVGERPLAPGRGLGVGLVLGIVVFGLKYSCLPLLALAILAWVPRERDSRFPMSFVAALVGGWMAVAVSIVVYFAITDRLEDFWRATVEFNWAHRGIRAPGAETSLLSRGFPFFGALWVLYGLSGWAVLDRLLWGRRGEVRDRLISGGVVLFGAALAQVFFQGKFWVYHYHVILLPLCLLSACGAQALVEVLDSAARRGRVVVVVGGLSLALVGISYGPVVDAYAQQHGLFESQQKGLPVKAGYETYLWGGSDFDYAETLEAARQVGLSSSQDESVFVWGFEPSIYWLAQRRPATRFFYDYPLSRRFGEVAALYELQLLRDLEVHAPAVVVVVARDANDLELKSSKEQLKEHPRIQDWLKRNYQIRWRVGDFMGYEVSGASPTSAPSSESP